MNAVLTFINRFLALILEVIASVKKAEAKKTVQEIHDDPINSFLTVFNPRNSKKGK